MRTRMYGGVGGEEPRGFPLSRLAADTASRYPFRGCGKIMYVTSATAARFF